ncbi:hypothetical protein BGW38_009864 [Lunasporangiospora selenospora]|uniref:Fe2OG dioxygenase domain-containing protein n=1 Tax=Lunasporangiospora selenospora TaxID=979761 RepID=A0A9P6KF54_9FUNG|nr:hypothetical protein BGW38_009864 [Lunasporangiospora selenospora]
MSKHGLTETPGVPIKRSKLSVQDGTAASSVNPPVFNSRYAEKAFTTAFVRAFRERESFQDQETGARVYEHPYPAAALPNFLDSADYVQTLRNELLQEAYFHKSNDLYEFYQSEDLRLSKKPHIEALKNAIYSHEFFAMMSSLTGIDLDPSVIDLNGNQYHEGCYLLCHDDDIKSEKEGRRIAFILYLVDEDWSAADGGALDLFRCNEAGYPVEVAQSLVPVRNSLAFFELSSTSYHQVAEVLSRDKTRISISGWFHGPLQTRLVSKTMPFYPLTSSEKDNELEELVNPDYLKKETMAKMNNVFLDQSSIELQGFFKPDVYKALVQEVEAIENEMDGFDSLWDETMGPRHVRSYSRVSDKNHTTIPPTLARAQSLFKSTLFESFLKEVTNLALPSANAELRMFKKGDYTLLHDHALEKSGLDAVFSFPHFGASAKQEWDENWGAGATHYVNGKSNLLTLQPKNNTLTLVLRDEGTLRFVRYLTARVGEARRRELSMLYTVEDEDEDEEEEEGDGPTPE